MIDLTWDTIRSIRDSFLKKSDWTQLIDVSLSEDEKKSWAEYRKNLRDITKTYRIPNEVIWPTPPNNE